MKKLENTTLSITGGLSREKKTSTFITAKEGFNGRIKDTKADNITKIMEELQLENQKSIFIKLLHQYIDKLNLQLNKQYKKNKTSLLNKSRKELK